MLSDSCREHRSHEHRNIRLEAAGVSHGAVLHRLPYSGGIRNGRPYYADGKPAYPSGVAGYHRRCVSLCRRPEQRPGRCFFGWFSHYNARLAADAGDSGACEGCPDRSQLRTSACDICYCILLSCALRPFCACKGKYRAVCRAGPFQHGAVYRTEHSVFIGV